MKLARLVALLVFGQTLSTSLVAGNQEYLLLADEAALTGGAVTALGRDLGSGWYNPAGLAALDRDSVKLSASVYGLRLFNLPGYLQADLPEGSQSKDVSSSELISVPATIFIGKVLKKGWYLSFGVLTPEDAKAREVNLLEAAGTDPSYTTYKYKQGVEFGYQDQIYDVGPALGWQATENLSLGIALYGHYRKSVFDDRAWADLRWDTGGTEAVTLRQEVAAKQTILSFLSLLGMQWDVGTWTLGARFRSPGLLAMYSLDYTVLTQYDLVLSGGGVSIFEYLEDKVDDYGSAVEGPWRGTLAIAKRFDKGWITLEVDASDLSGKEGVGAIWNAKAGARWELNKTWALGLGLHTDTARAVPVEYFGQRRIDYYGGNIGLQAVTDYPLESRPGQPLKVVSTFGLRYTTGRGTAGGLVMDPLLNSGNVSYVKVVDAGVQEVALYLGSGLLF